MKRTKKLSPVAIPQQPPRERFRPSWYTEDRRWTHGQTYRLDYVIDVLSRGELRLPRFQRPWRWGDADMIYLLDSFMRGCHIGPLLLWQREDLPASVERFGEFDVTSPAGSATLVIDGQQRLGAIATAFLGDRFFFHLLDGTFSTDGPGPWRVPVSRMAGALAYDMDRDGRLWPDVHAAEHGLDAQRVRDAWVCAYSTMGRVEISCIMFDYRWDLRLVVESYRRLNTTGVKMSAEDLEAGLRRATE